MNLAHYYLTGRDCASIVSIIYACLMVPAVRVVNSRFRFCTSLVPRPTIVVFGLGTRLHVCMRTTLENGDDIKCSHKWSPVRTLCGGEGCSSRLSVVTPPVLLSDGSTPKRDARKWVGVIHQWTSSGLKRTCR